MIIQEFHSFKDLINDKFILNASLLDMYIYNKENYNNKINFTVFNILELAETIKNNGNFNYDCTNPKNYNTLYKNSFNFKINMNKVLNLTDCKIIDEINNELKNDIFLYKIFKPTILADIITIEIECSDYLYSMFLLNKTLKKK